MKKTKTNESFLAMPFFDSLPKVDNEGFLKTITDKWALTPKELEGDNQNFSIVINGEQFIFGLIETPIPRGDMNYVLRQNENRVYLPSLSNEITGHFIISLISNNSDSLEKFKLFTMVIDSFLENSNAIGIYLGDQGLIFSKVSYLKFSRELEQDNLPIELWIFFGYSENEDGIKQFTRGLNFFGRPEIQLHDKAMNLDEGYNFLFGITKYLLSRNITFHENEKLMFNNKEYLVSIISVNKAIDDVILLVKPSE